MVWCLLFHLFRKEEDEIDSIVEQFISDKIQINIDIVSFQTQN